MAGNQTDLDKKVGGEPADVVPWTHDGARTRPSTVPMDKLLPESEMPLMERPNPFRIKGGGTGG